MDSPTPGIRRQRSANPYGQDPREAGVLRHPGAGARRWLFLGLVAATAGSAIATMAHLLGSDGFTGLELLILVSFSLTFLWITVAFWTSTAGLALVALRRDPLSLRRAPSTVPGDAPITTRTALVMPVHNEDPNRVMAGLAAMLRSLERTGAGDRFHTYLLSDTTDPVIARRERAAWAALRDEFAGTARIYYRRRARNTGRKPGNITDFCRRWGGYYDFMVVLDADSIMEGSTLLALVRIMQDNPDAGLVQTLPAPVHQDTLFGRMLQFGRWLYGPMVAAGLSFWQTDASHYWGHNAIVRMKPFLDHCGLASLPGDPPMGGDILSHDFVEGALLRRAGWKVFLLPWTGGSYEGVPGNILDYAKRDRRWTQGNLQHLRLIPAPGLHYASRLQFLFGAMSYLASPIWLVMLLACTAYAVLPGSALVAGVAGASPAGGEWPMREAGFVIPLLVLVVVVLFLPKILALALFAARHPRRFGGVRRLLASGLAEMIGAVVIAPIMMMYHSQFVVSVLRGRDAGWQPQVRTRGAVPWREAWRRTAVVTVVGITWSALAFIHGPWLVLWLSPILAGMVLAAPLVRWTSDRGAGVWARSHGLFLVPPETFPLGVLMEASRPWAEPSRTPWPERPGRPAALPPEQPRPMAEQRLVRRWGVGRFVPSRSS